ncbi:9070_t:CDS:2 [Cetraspora pellucida]|uniref:9070_t:CDS:1 n=1 Tax=Cetraspora pellucida TaxID=1433469 RepID=A0ACA9LHB2_9GLOM|nr:9070_t:CDS:2 [Cetraspora pellucida]
MCLEKEGEVVGVIVGNVFTDGAANEAEMSNSYSIILTTKNRLPITFLNLTLDIFIILPSNFPSYV